MKEKKVKKELSEKEKEFTFFISNEDINDIIKTIKSLDPGVLIDGVTETVKDEIKNKRVDLLELC